MKETIPYYVPHDKKPCELKRMDEVYQGTQVDIENFLKGLYEYANLDTSKGKEDKRYHGILSFDKSFNHIYRQIHKDTDITAVFSSLYNREAFVTPFTYCGTVPKKKEMRQLCAFVFSLPTLGYASELCCQTFGASGLMPTYMVVGEKTTDLYFVLKTPIPMYDSLQKPTQIALLVMCHKLGLMTCDNNGVVAYRNFASSKYQGRQVTDCKIYKTGNAYSVEQMNKTYFPHCPLLLPNPKMTREEAMETYPIWAERVLKKKQYSKSKTNYYTADIALYKWWLKKAEGFNNKPIDKLLAATAVYAVKCAVSKSDYLIDAKHLFAVRGLSFGDSLPLASDIFDIYAVPQSRFMTVEQISKLAHVKIKKGKRNHRTKKEHGKHLKAMYRNRVLSNPNAFNNKMHLVCDWKKNNPGRKKIECARALGIAPSTVSRWWGYNVYTPKSYNPISHKYYKRPHQKYCHKCGKWSQRTEWRNEALKKNIFKSVGSAKNRKRTVPVMSYSGCPCCIDLSSVFIKALKFRPNR